MSTTTTEPAPTSAVTHPSTTWIRPWYPGAIDVNATKAAGHVTLEGHLFADCDELLRVATNPQAGAGWLDPRAGGTCELCLHRHDPELYAEITDEKDAAA